MSASPLFPQLPSGWTEKIFYINNQESEKDLALRAYLSPKFSPPADRFINKFLFIVHGQGEQSGRYEHFPHYLNGNVDAIFCVDLPGHGLSKGPRGHIERFSQYHQAALDAFLFAESWFKQYAPQPKAYWFGHSLGGLISLGTLMSNPQLNLQSACISAPLLEIAVPVPALKKFFGELVEPILGRLPLKNELDGSLVSHDSSVAKAYDEDPLNHGFVTPRFFVQLTQEMKRIRESEAEFPYPLLLVVPLDDKIVSAPENLRFFGRLKMKSGVGKALCSLPNYYHEAFNDYGKERPFNALARWIEAGV